MTCFNSSIHCFTFFLPPYLLNPVTALEELADSVVLAPR